MFYPRFVLACVLLVSGFVFPSGPALAGDREWTDIMPVGGDVSAIVSTGDALYIAVEKQIYRSSDGGASWALVTELQSEFSHSVSPISALAVVPGSPQILLAGALREIFRSTDGVAWDGDILGESSSGAVPTVRAISVAPSDPATIYAGRWPGGIYISSDSGTSWAETASQPSSVNITALAVDQADSGVVYAGTFDGGLFITLDGGASWTAATGLPARVSTIHASPHTPGLVFASFSGFSGGEWRSADYGANWTQPTGLPLSGFVEVGAFRSDPTSAQTLYAGYRAGSLIPGPGVVPPGLYRSTDGGNSWSALPWPATEPRPNMNAVHVDSADANAIVVGTREGMYRSVDGGSTWAAANDGLASTHISTVSFGARADELYASNRAAGLFGSKDGGATWSRLATGLNWRGAAAIAADPVVPGKLISQQYTTGFLLSNDDGATWVTRPGSTGETFAIEFDPTHTSTVYAYETGKVWKSVDGGDSWNSHTAGLPSTPASVAMAVAPSDTAVIYVTTADGVYKSTDAGETWLDASGGESWLAGSIVVHPHDADIVFAAANDLYRTVDGGETWERINSFSGEARQIAIDANDPMRMLMVGTSIRGMQGTVDGGARWHALNDGLDGLSGAFEAATLAFDPHKEGRYIVATRGSAFGRLQSYTGPIAVDLVVSATRTPASVAVGSDITVEFAVANTIGYAATDIEIGITHPANFTLSDAQLDGASCTTDGNALTCVIAALPVGENRAGSFLLRGVSGGAGTLAISAGSPDADNNAADNSVQMSVAVQMPASPPVPSPSPQPTPSTGGGGHAGWWAMLPAVLLMRRRQSRAALNQAQSRQGLLRASGR